jgi:hypothetical protein
MCVRCMMGGGRSKGGGASLFGAVRVYEVLSVPSKNTSCGGLGKCYAAHSSLMQRVGRDEPTEVTPRRLRWGHSCIDVLSFGQGDVLGRTTLILDDGEGRADTVSGGRNPFAEAMRCPLESGGRRGARFNVCIIQPCRRVSLPPADQRSFRRR